MGHGRNLGCQWPSLASRLRLHEGKVFHVSITGDRLKA